MLSVNSANNDGINAIDVCAISEGQPRVVLDNYAQPKCR